MPWVTLLAGCLAGIGYLALLAIVNSNSQPFDQGNVRLAFLPAVAALAFVPAHRSGHCPRRPPSRPGWPRPAICCWPPPSWR